MASKPKTSSLDTNHDGKISAQEAKAGGSSDDILSGLGVPPPSADASKGPPLFPYDVSDPSEVPLVPDAKSGKKIGPRYYEADTLGPLKWSPETRAALQDAMFRIGLYGDNKVTLGSWGADDQAALAELLSEANVEGRTWDQQLAFWKAHPPEALLAKLKSSAAKKPTIQLTNPLDIQNAARQESQNILGRVDRSAVAGAVPDYQAVEKQAQQAAIDDQAAGGGGVVAQPPSLDSYLSDRMRREHPIEADGYSFVNKFDTFRNLIGAQHMAVQ